MQNEKYDLNSNDVFFFTNMDDDFYFFGKSCRDNETLLLIIIKKTKDITDQGTEVSLILQN